MKVLNLTSNDIFVSDLGLDRNDGTEGRALNQARYIPSGLTSGSPDPTKAVQLIETDAVKLSAAEGQLSALVASGSLAVTSVGDNVELSISSTKPGDPTFNPIFFDDYVFGRPVLITKLKLFPNAAPGVGNVMDVIFKKNNVAQQTAKVGWNGIGTALTAALAGAGAGNVDNGTHSYAVTLVTNTGESYAGASSNVVTVADHTINGQVSLTGIPLGIAGLTTGRNIYRKVAGNTGNYKFLHYIADNTTATYTDNTADSGLGGDAPTTNTTGTLFEYTHSNSGEITIDVTGMKFAAGTGNAWTDTDKMDLLVWIPGTVGDGFSSDISGITSIKVTVVYEEVD